MLMVTYLVSLRSGGQNKKCEWFLTGCHCVQKKKQRNMSLLVRRHCVQEDKTSKTNDT